jgi:hypothetical protein
LIWSFPIVLLLGTGSRPLIALALVGTGVGSTAMFAPLASQIAEKFSVEVRCTGASMGYQIGSILGGGFARFAAALFAAARQHRSRSPATWSWCASSASSPSRRSVRQAPARGVDPPLPDAFISPAPRPVDEAPRSGAVLSERAGRSGQRARIWSCDGDVRASGEPDDCAGSRRRSGCDHDR